jgi:glyoxylase-like metal-dependent hydrolase (beta-lactamase superfamily II)
MRIHALSTGTVRVKRSFLFPSSGARRQLDLFLPGPFSDPLPIHCWAVEHEGRLMLVDTGETAAARNIPFARFEVAPDQELSAALSTAGLSVGDVQDIVFTHHHGDHVDGVAHLTSGGRATMHMHAAELAFAAQPFSRLMRGVLRQPLPGGFSPKPFELEGPAFGAFERSRPLSRDGRIVAVPTPGHTPGHVSVVCVEDDGRHVMLAGDVTDTLEQLHARRPDAIGPDPGAHRATLERIFAHCEKHPTVYLPSHDPDSARRLKEGVTVASGGAPGHTVASAGAPGHTVAPGA